MAESLAVRIEWWVREHPGCSGAQVAWRFRHKATSSEVAWALGELVRDDILTAERRTVNTDPMGKPVIADVYWHRMTYRGPREDAVEPPVPEEESTQEPPVEDHAEEVTEPNDPQVDPRTVDALSPAILRLARRVYPAWLSMLDAAKEIADPRKEGYMESVMLARDILEKLHGQGELEMRTDSKGTVMYRVSERGSGSSRTVRMEKAKANRIWEVWLKLNKGEPVEFERTKIGPDMTLSLTPRTYDGLTIKHINGDSNRVTSVNWVLSETRTEYLVFRTIRDTVSVEVVG